MEKPVQLALTGFRVDRPGSEDQKLDYNPYRVKARVDWIEITITTAAKTQAANLQKRGKFTYVTGHDQHGQALPKARKNEPADRFTIRHQDPKNWQDIVARIARLGTPETARGTPYIVASTELAGLEIALDLEADGATLNELAGVVANLAWFTMSPPHDQARDPTRPEPFDPDKINFRTYRENGEKARYPKDLETLAQHLADGWQVGIGDQHANRYVHAYAKTSNQVNGKRESCKPVARFENTLRGDMLDQLGDIDALAFTALAPLFKFGKIKPGTDKLTKILMTSKRKFPAWRIDDDGQRTVGRTRVSAGRRAGERAMLPGIQPETSLNKRAADALTSLTRRWRAAPENDVGKNA